MQPVVIHLYFAAVRVKIDRLFCTPFNRGDSLTAPKTGLYDPLYEHDACGLGFVARVDGCRTRETVDEGLEILCNLAHRGTTGSDPETGDGAGMLLQVPDAFLRRECASLGIELPPAGGYGVGMLFEFAGEEGLDCEGMLCRIVA